MNKFRLGRWTVFLLLASLLACNHSTISRNITVTPNKPATTPTLLVVETPTETRTLSMRTPTVSPSPEMMKTATVTDRSTVFARPSPSTFLPTTTQVYTDTYSYKGKIIPFCAGKGMPMQPPEGFEIHGTIVYQENEWKGLYTIGGTPLTRGQLPVNEEQDYYAFGFTPDGKWLAYTPIIYSPDGSRLFENPSILLLSNTGEKQEHILDIKQIQKIFRITVCIQMDLVGRVIGLITI